MLLWARLRRGERVLRQLILMLMLVALAPLARAAPKRPAPVHDQKQEKEARAHFDRAERAFNLRRFDEALAGYQAAYEALPLPAFLFNIAQCHRNLGNRDQAIFFYQRYLTLDPEAPNRRIVEDLIAEQKRPPPPPAPASRVDLNLHADPSAANDPREQPRMKAATWQRTRWWLAGGLAVAVVAGVALFALRPAGELPMGNAGTVDARFR
jgi:tetratricopeptide (TPR) repeat protein